MRTFFILWKREIGTYFYTPLALVLLVTIVFLTGFNFYSSVAFLNHGPSNTSIVEIFFRTFFFWGPFLITPSLITMRLFAEEYRSGTLEALMTAPVRVTQVVLAKYCGALFLFVVFWAPSLLYFALFWPSAHQTAAASYGSYIGAYAILLVQGMLFLAVGSLASALTSHQVIAGMISFCGVIFLFFIGLLVPLLHITTSEVHTIITLISPMETMKTFSRGIIDTRSLVFYLSMTLFFLFFTLQVFQLRRWRQ
ncbi:MAG: ABC transporter permease [Chthoniobacterales bacterium]|nr:ABC transporter permease [Chthoniobacterales bacterium]